MTKLAIDAACHRSFAKTGLAVVNMDTGLFIAVCHSFLLDSIPAEQQAFYLAALWSQNDDNLVIYTDCKSVSDAYNKLKEKGEASIPMPILPSSRILSPVAEVKHFPRSQNKKANFLATYSRNSGFTGIGLLTGDGDKHPFRLRNLQPKTKEQIYKDY
jgi:hypothetical protein